MLDTKQGQTDLNAQTIDVKASGVTVNGTVNFNGGTVQGGPINGGAGNEIFNFNGGSIANNLEIDAKDGTNIFNLRGTTFGTGVDLKGGVGSDTVTADDANNIFTISGTNNGSVRGVTVSGIEAYVGSGTDTVRGRGVNDAFQITGNQSLNSSGMAFSQVQVIDGLGGTDTVTSSTSAQTIALTGNKQGTILGLGFRDIETFQASGTDVVQGGSGGEMFTVTGGNAVNVNNINFTGVLGIDGKDGSDTYQLNDGVPPSAIAINDTGTGAGEIDRLDYSAYTTDPNVNLAAIGAVGIEEVRGRATGNSTITALNQSNTWTLNNGGSGTINTLSFFNFNRLIGGNLSDTFTVSSGASGFNLINGGLGSNAINNSTANQILTISGPNQGLFRGITFQSIATFQGSGTDTLLGTTGDDIFSASVANAFALKGVNVTGVNDFDGLAGNDTVVNTAGPQIVTITGNNQISTLGKTFRAIENFTGSGNDTINGTGGDDIFNIPAANTMQSSGVNFTGVSAIDGGSGSNTINNPNANQNIAISGPNQALFRGIAFQNIAIFQGSGTDTLLGTPGDDIFSASGANVFTLSGVNITGVNAFDGLAGNDTVVNTAGAQPVSIIGNNQISTLGKTFRAIENFTGSGNDTIDGTGGDDIFSITAANTLQSAGVNFTGVSAIDGKNSSDTYQLSNGVPPSAIALAGTGIDTVYLEGGTVGTVNLGDGNDLFVIKPGSGTASTVNLGAGDDEVQVKGNSRIVGTLDGGAGRLTILGKDNLQGLPTAANSIAGTGVLQLGTIDSKTDIIINDDTTNSKAIAITPTNLQVIKPGFKQVLLEANNIDIESNVEMTGNPVSLKASTGSITARSATFSTKDGNLTIDATKLDLQAASKITTTTGNIDITAPSIMLTGKAGTPGIAIDRLSQSLPDRAEIATRSFTPGVASGNLTLNTTNLTLSNAALIAETGRGASKGNVRIHFPVTPQTPGKLEFQKSSLILAQGDSRSNGDIVFTGNAAVEVDLAKSPAGQDGSDIITNADPNRQGGAILFETKDNPGPTFKPLAQSFSNLRTGFRIRKAQVGNGTNDLSSNERIDLPPPSDQQSDDISTEFTDPNKLVSAECQPNNRQADRRSQFSISGKGGLPSNPITVLRAESSQDDWVTLPVPKAPPKPIAQAPTKLKPPTNQPAQCLQSWQDS